MGTGKTNQSESGIHTTHNRTEQGVDRITT